MTDLKTKIEALTVHEMDTMQGVIDVVDREAVLVLVATHAAETAPVAVEGVCPKCNGSGVVDTPFGLMDRSKPSNRHCDCQWPRADLAPKGNTELVEAALDLTPEGIERQANQLEQCKMWGAAAILRALSQPAAPQPTPEVDLRDLGCVECGGSLSLPSDVVCFPCLSAAALARGSVAEKGKRT